MQLLILILYAMGFYYTPEQIILTPTGTDPQITRAQHIIDDQLYYVQEDGGIVIEDDVAGSRGCMSAVVVFDVVRAQRNLAVLNQDVLIGNEQVTLLFLRAVGGNFHDFALAGRQADELAARGSGRSQPAEEPKGEQKRRWDSKPATERGD